MAHASHHASAHHVAAASAHHVAAAAWAVPCATDTRLACVAGPCRGGATRYSQRCDVHNWVAPVFRVHSIGVREGSSHASSHEADDGAGDLEDEGLRRQILDEWPFCEAVGRESYGEGGSRPAA